MDRCRQGVDNGLGKNPLRRVFFRLNAGAAEGCDLLILLLKAKSKRSQPGRMSPRHEAINCRNT
jgi:hypothetical protein